MAEDNMQNQLRTLVGSAAAVVAIAVSVIIGIAILTAFKTTALVDNTTVDLFIAGLVIFGSFIGVIVIGVIGKILLTMFKGRD